LSFILDEIFFFSYNPFLINHLAWSPFVKKFIKQLTSTCLFAAASLMAENDIDVEDLSNEQIQQDARGPFSVELSGDWIGPAKFDKHHCHFGRPKLKFATGQIDLNMVYYYNPCFNEGASVGVSYTRTRLDWRYNPFFTQKDFDMISVVLGGLSERFQDWTWKGQVTINFDNIEHWRLENYMSYDLLLWGRYAFRPNIGVHLGFIALTGMKIDRVYPIVGIDWTYNRHWKISAVFPTDISLTYTYNDCWSFLVAARFINQRHRVKKDQFFSEGLWFYTSSGAEAAIKYTPTKRITVNVHGGYNFGGHLKIANRHYKQGRRFGFDGAPYAGAEIDVNF
jgi:Domain of unknown function (DUF6268)